MSESQVSGPRDIAISLAISTLAKTAPITDSLAAAFKEAGHTLALVGGPVRDAILGRLGNDLDFTTDARPDVTKAILKNGQMRSGIPEQLSGLSLAKKARSLLK